MVAACEDALEVLCLGLTRVLGRTGVEDGIGGDGGELLEELLLGNHDGLTTVAGLDTAIGVVVDTLWDVELVVQVADHLDEAIDELLVCRATKVQDLLGDEGVALAGTGVPGVPLDGLSQVHGIGSTMYDVATLEDGPGLVCHRVHDAEQAG